MGLRYNNWKLHFMVQDQAGTMEIWQRKLGGCEIAHTLRTVPYEFARITSNTYGTGISTTPGFSSGGLVEGESAWLGRPGRHLGFIQGGEQLPFVKADPQ